jgi:small subunit ribosomal protein S15
MLTKRVKASVIRNAALHDTDSGSARVQISILSRKIEELTSHLKKNQKDFSSRRGLLQMVADRRSHLRYLERTDKRQYNSVIKQLGLKR